VRRAVVRVFVFVQLLSLLLEACMDLGKKKNAGNFCEAFSPRKSVEALCSCVNYFVVFFSPPLSIRSFVFSLCRSELRLSSFW